MDPTEEQILRALIDGPMTFDELMESLDVTKEELQRAIDVLEGAQHIHADISTEFKWGLVPLNPHY